jgi:hypothetical protein
LLRKTLAHYPLTLGDFFLKRLYFSFRMCVCVIGPRSWMDLVSRPPEVPWPYLVRQRCFWAITVNDMR